jgi:hypothetical protein
MKFWAISIIEDLIPPCPSGRIGRGLYRAAVLLVVVAYYLCWKYFLRLTLPMLLGVFVMCECLTELPPFQNYICAIGALGLMMLYLNELYTTVELRKQIAELEREIESHMVYELPDANS